MIKSWIMEAAEQFIGKEHAKTYSRYNRDTPPLLTEKIICYLKEKYDDPLDMAVDVACGPGQSTVTLAPFFRKVHGLDVSEAQIQEARLTRSRPNVTYKVASAESLPFPDNSVQLVSVGCGLHWFEIDVFLSEVRRVLCDNGILAVYFYGSMKPVLDDAAQVAKVDQLFWEVYETLDPYFAPEIKIAIERYKNVIFPFEEVLRLPDFRDTFSGQLSDVVGYLSSFSAFENLRKKDEKKAEEVLSHFKCRLEEIVTASNVPVDETIQLYRDFLLILCRKKEVGC